MVATTSTVQYSTCLPLQATERRAEERANRVQRSKLSRTVVTVQGINVSCSGSHSPSAML